MGPSHSLYSICCWPWGLEGVDCVGGSPGRIWRHGEGGWGFDFSGTGMGGTMLTREHG